MTTRSRRRLALALLALISALAAGAIHERDLARRMSNAVVAYFQGSPQARQFALAADGGQPGGGAAAGPDERDGAARHAALAPTQAPTHTRPHGQDGGGAPGSEADLFTLGAPAAGPRSEGGPGGSSGGDGGAPSGPAGDSSADAGSGTHPAGSFSGGLGADNFGAGSRSTTSEVSPADDGSSVSNVPEPDELALMGAGVLALIGIAWKRKSR
jgi:hypothetical protein